MESIAAVIVPAAERMLGLAEALLVDAPADAFPRFASPGGRPIHANHGAFIYGHLSLYPARLLQAAGIDDPAINADKIAVPAHYTDLFQHGAECRDDPEHTIYPAMDELTTAFARGHRGALDIIKTWPDEKFNTTHALEGGIGEVFPTLAQLTNFLLLGHTMMHLGQMSTWRRALGLGSAM